MIERLGDTKQFCKYCLEPGHTALRCFKKAKDKQPTYGNAKMYSSFGGRRKAIKKQSAKEKDYQVWKETVARPALIARDGNKCSCCQRSAQFDEKLDIEHTFTKGSRPDLKRDLTNMTLMCRWPCHDNKTNGIVCLHVMSNI